MRTTLTINDDLARKLKETAAAQGKSFKEVVNATLQRGLGLQTGSSRARQRIKLVTRQLDYRPGIDEVKLKDHLDDFDLEADVGTRR